jgi:hypothetical protein
MTPPEQIEGKIRTIGFYQPFCSLMLHGKVETRWVRLGRFAAFPLGTYIGYSTKIGCSIEKMKEWCGDLYDYTCRMLADDATQHMHGYALWIGDLIKIGKMYPYQEKECFVKYDSPQIRKDKNGQPHEYWQQVMYFENVVPIEPFEFKFGKQGVGIFPDSHKHLIKQSQPQ